MDSGNETETNVIDDQPIDAVVADIEITEATPQAKATDTQELYVDDEEGDQEKPKSNMSQEQAYAAFRKEQDKRKRKNIELDEEKAERAKLQREVDELKATVGDISKKKVPTLEDCDYDEDRYQQSVQEYYSKPKDSPVDKKATNDPVNNQANDEAEFYLYQREQELTKVLPEYDKAKDELTSVLKEKYKVASPEMVFMHYSDIAKQNGIDIAKSLLAMNKVPSILEELNKTSNPFAIAKILEKAAGKVKSRSAKSIDTQPEPNITNKGQIDNAQGTVDKLYKAWKAKPSLDNHRRYMAAKNKVN